jgi:diadenosine tetraphosphate (Ap4A) HIT family hydrolase
MPEKLIFQSPKNPNSHLTIKERKYASFPTKRLLIMDQIRGRVLDFGCGLGIDVRFLSKNGFETIGYDPYYAPEIPVGQFDTILCNYVLNVLLAEEQVQVLMAVAELLKPSGKAFFTVRRDIKRGGFRTHTKLGIEIFQCNVTLPYKSILQAEHCEIYEYQHFNQLSRFEQGNCVFCTPDCDRELVTESATVYAMLDKYPVTRGHALIIPKQHVDNYFELNDRTKTACWIVVDRVKRLLKNRFQPDGFNVGMNIGHAAGQTIPHAHIHLIPRYKGDVENPEGGVRGVIPGKSDYHLKKGL